MVQTLKLLQILDSHLVLLPQYLVVYIIAKLYLNVLRLCSDVEI
jgi:hypothetical protein